MTLLCELVDARAEIANLKDIIAIQGETLRVLRAIMADDAIKPASDVRDPEPVKPPPKPPNPFRDFGSVKDQRRIGG